LLFVLCLSCASTKTDTNLTSGTSYFETGKTTTQTQEGARTFFEQQETADSIVYKYITDTLTIEKKVYSPSRTLTKIDTVYQSKLQIDSVTKYLHDTLYIKEKSETEVSPIPRPIQELIMKIVVIIAVIVTIVISAKIYFKSKIPLFWRI